MTPVIFPQLNFRQHLNHRLKTVGILVVKDGQILRRLVWILR